MTILRVIIDWAEVWAVLIPLAVLITRKPPYDWVKPVALYLIVALILNIVVDTIWYGNKYKLFAVSNNLFYNIHSFVRFFLFTWFFTYLGKPFPKLNRFVSFLFVVAAIIVYGFIDRNIININSKMLALEAALLLGYCLVFFFSNFL